MNNSFMKKALITIPIAAALVAGGYYWGSRHAASVPVTQQTERRVLYWYDPMSPDRHFDQPGKSPFMDMPLQPRYADEAAADGGVAVSARQQQNLGVRTEAAAIRPLQAQVSGYGTVTLDERAIHTLTAPSGGIVERLAVSAAQQPVQKGQTLAVLWNPAWAAAQQEYLAVRTLGDAALTRAARRKLSLLFMPEDTIRAVERSGLPQPRLTVSAPENGFVNQLEVRAGSQLSPAQPLFELASLESVWVEVEYPEAQAALLAVGSPMLAHSAAWPGVDFHGRIAELLPRLDADTRTLRARVELSNPQQRLKPGMYLSVQLTGQTERQALTVPQQALLVSGSRNRVLVSDGNGYFTPREVQVGLVQDGRAEILNGLQPGESVVASGQFLIDSEASLDSALPAFGDAAPAAESPTHTAESYTHTAETNAPVAEPHAHGGHQ